MVELRVRSLASGSSGNALLIDAGATRLLVDAGISARRIEVGLAQLGVAARDLDAVLVTHEHSDHIAGLAVLGRRHQLPVYMTRGTARATPNAISVTPRLIAPTATFSVGEVSVTAIPLRHDANDPCGYLIEAAGATVIVLTDFGYPDTHLDAALARADLIVIEANHDLDRLWSGPYTWALKQRVASASGHLCNEDCGLLLARALNDGRPRTVWLAHLSQENNEPALARATVTAQIGDRPLDLHILPRDRTGPLWRRSLG